MDLLAALLLLALSGFLVGGVARFAVPGPDPMPIWLTIAFGVVGMWLGGGIGWALGAELGALLGGILVAVLMIVLYRRLVQRRGITGPDAQRAPTRGFGIRRRRS